VHDSNTLVLFSVSMIWRSAMITVNDVLLLSFSGRVFHWAGMQHSSLYTRYEVRH